MTAEWRGAAGFCFADLLVATAVALAMLGVVVAVVASSADQARLQPEAADVHQRLRTAAEAVRDRLDAAGAGPSVGDGAGALARRVPVVFPHRRAPAGGDAALSAYGDRITVFSVVPDVPLAVLSTPMSSAADVLRLAPVPGCPLATPTCRFEVGSRALVSDATGAFEVFTVAAITGDALHQSSLAATYDPAKGAAVVPIRAAGLFFDPTAHQLRATSGGPTSFPLLDDVVRFRVEYVGITEAPVSPRPPPGVPGCAYDAAGVRSLPELAPNWGELRRFSLAELADGPACGAGSSPYDADLLRIRRVRVTVRVDAASASLRGADPLRFLRPGTAGGPGRWVPDAEVTFDVTPRNLRDGR